MLNFPKSLSKELVDQNKENWILNEKLRKDYEEQNQKLKRIKNEGNRDENKENILECQVINNEKLNVYAEQNEKTEYLDNELKKLVEIHENRIVILGPNGAGKSRLGIFISQNNKKTIRISAQKILNFNHIIPMEPLESVIGKTIELTRHIEVSQEVDNFQKLLSSLCALEREKQSNYWDNSRKLKEHSHKETIREIEQPETEIEAIKRIWDDLFPHRIISVSKDKFTAKDLKGIEFPASGMSDGERVAFYIIGHVLIAKENGIIIIDEPENHLHKAILEKLFDRLESERSDCMFVYITHDLDFATSRRNAKKIWIKGYYGDPYWEWEEIPDKTELPEELLFKVLGSRKPILFVEGEKDSLDVDIYNLAYPDYTVIPVSGCGDVIKNTVAFQNQEKLHNKRVFGIIDRDYRTEEEIKELSEKGLLFIDCAEVENLFLIEEIIRFVAKRLEKNEDEEFSKISDRIIRRFRHEIDEQIINKTNHILRTKLIEFKPSLVKFTESELSNRFEEYLKSNVRINDIHNKSEKHFYEIMERENYSEILKFYNKKKLFNSALNGFIISADKYHGLVKDLLRSETGKPVLEALREYLPTIEITE